LISLLHSFLL
jgi:hypothetical protein